jgi:hypothetical protein
MTGLAHLNFVVGSLSKLKSSLSSWDKRFSETEGCNTEITNRRGEISYLIKGVTIREKEVMSQQSEALKREKLWNDNGPVLSG